MRSGGGNETVPGHDRETTPDRNSCDPASRAPASVRQEAVTRLLTLAKTTRAGRGTATWTRDELHER